MKKKRCNRRNVLILSERVDDIKSKKIILFRKKNESKQLVQIAEKTKKKKRLTDTITHTYYT